VNGEIRVAELFAGIGGFRLGLERANPCNSRIENGKTLLLNTDDKPMSYSVNQDGNGRQQCTNNYKIVWANEHDKHACQIYRKNFGEKELIEADIETVNPKDIPDFDMLVGGFPCQPFSLAGERKGFSDKRGNLFFEVARILESKRPKIVFLENVRGLLSAQNGFCFWSILNRLDELGYNVEWKVLNTKNWLPQTRERVFIIGHLREGSGCQIFPFGSYDEEDSCKGQTIGTLTAGAHSGGLHSDMTAVIANTLRSGGRSSLDRHSFDVVLLDNLGGNIKQRVKENGIAWTLGGSKTAVVQEKKGRRLTERECERLQGFPDDWTKGVSQTQRYKMLGNAVSVPVIEYIGKLILEDKQ
jgi:DNA (cytosine-5)-methyltransferase 1